MWSNGHVPTLHASITSRINTAAAQQQHSSTQQDSKRAASIGGISPTPPHPLPRIQLTSTLAMDGQATRHSSNPPCRMFSMRWNHSRLAVPPGTHHGVRYHVYHVGSVSSRSREQPGTTPRQRARTWTVPDPTHAFYCVRAHRRKCTSNGPAGSQVDFSMPAPRNSHGRYEPVPHPARHVPARCRAYVAPVFTTSDIHRNAARTTPPLPAGGTARRTATANMQTRVVGSRQRSRASCRRPPVL